MEINAQDAPIKPHKGAMILLKEVPGGMNVLVTFLDENDKPVGGEFDEKNLAHAIAKAAPIIIGAISDDFQNALEPTEPIDLTDEPEAQSCNIYPMSFIQWWDEEAREYGIDVENGESMEIAEIAWNAALRNKPDQNAQPAPHTTPVFDGVNIDAAHKVPETNDLTEDGYCPIVLTYRAPDGAEKWHLFVESSPQQRIVRRGEMPTEQEIAEVTYGKDAMPWLVPLLTVLAKYAEAEDASAHRNPDADPIYGNSKYKTTTEFVAAIQAGESVERVIVDNDCVAAYRGGEIVCDFDGDGPRLVLIEVLGALGVEAEQP